MYFQNFSSNILFPALTTVPLAFYFNLREFAFTISSTCISLSGLLGWFLTLLNTSLSDFSRRGLIFM